ncbi:hypothetical protein H9Q10_08625 [Eikenella sp. S3360]|uniref:Uncharacterized protein n=1 Tax=Eikenella glucosivorans TaxID=2766967 RepID=A0ABS0NBQ1_9NEIS|nr:hypothetical protein [Eikenella glucosivorans]MBH5329731.1 hypothetical protein [Eikenella glucosivorans]
MLRKRRSKPADASGGKSLGAKHIEAPHDKRLPENFADGLNGFGFGKTSFQVAFCRHGKIIVWF